MMSFTISQARTAAMSLALFSIFLMACASEPVTVSDPSPSSDALLGIRWTVALMNGEPVNVEQAERRPWLRLEQEEHRLTGYSGCNRMFGTYSLDGQKLSFGPIAATKMACLDGPDLESVFFDCLDQTRGWKMDGEMLVFQDADGKPLAEFERSSTP